MRVLVIDTALGLCSAGVFEVEAGRVRALGLRSEAMTKGHQERLAGMVRDAAADPAVGPPRPLYLRAPDATPPSRLPGQPRPVAPGA